MGRPEFLSQGEPARLFPVLSTTSKEGRTTSIVLACLSKVNEFGTELLAAVGQKFGKRAKIETYTEVVFHGQKDAMKDRPDGLIIVRTGSRTWSALVEAKVGNNNLDVEQIERYRALAKEHGIDCVITVSNQFATVPTNHPIAEVRKSRSKIPVYHWSWMFVLTTADLLLNNAEIADEDQELLLNELRRFLTHESAGVHGFDRMPPEWTELNRLVSAGGSIPAKSPEAVAVLEAWHQETKDLSLILSRQTETAVREKLPRKHVNDPGERLKDELARLREDRRLYTCLEIVDAAAPIEVTADIPRRTIDVGMTLRAPEDKVSSRARVNWLLRQIKSDKIDDLHVRLIWPGRSEATQYSVKELIEDVTICERDKGTLQVSSFHIFYARRLGARFTQQTNFIVDLEDVVPAFYREIGQELSAWRKAAPKIKEDRSSAAEVSPDAIAEEAEEVAKD
ncbi:hypothetical protein [Actibacterium sp.]|uniref:hypothetical protein n=1 Tax=Actibacterium sp. TaxID=1872125 RepID=UPI003563635E